MPGTLEAALTRITLVRLADAYHAESYEGAQTSAWKHTGCDLFDVAP